MRISHDPEVDAAYIYMVDEIGRGEVARTYPCDPREVDGEINLDFDVEGRLLGIEIQDASHLLPSAVLDAPGAE